MVSLRKHPEVLRELEEWENGSSIGGWLAVAYTVLILNIIGNILGVLLMAWYATSEYFESGEGIKVLTMASIILLHLTLSIFTIMDINHRRQSAKLIAQITFIVGFFSSIMGALMFETSLLGPLIVGLPWALGWFLYFEFSERVKETFNL